MYIFFQTCVFCLNFVDAQSSTAEWEPSKVIVTKDDQSKTLSLYDKLGFNGSLKMPEGRTVRERIEVRLNI